MNKAFFVFVVGIICLSCSKYDKEMPSDFSFKFIDIPINSYDSKTGQYTRSYISNDSVVLVKLTQSEMNTIYGLFKKYDFLDFPEVFECDPNSISYLPAFDTRIEITYKGKIKTVTNTDFCEKKLEQKNAANFDELSSVIREILNSKIEIKNMREGDMVFM